MPGAVWIIGMPRPVQIVFYYGILCFVLLLCRKEFWESTVWEKAFRKKRIGNKKLWIGKLGISALLLAAGIGLLGFRMERGLEITFLDVGQGDCIYVQTAGGSRYLIDGGSTSKSKVGKYQITPFLKSRGVESLDMVFVSHGDKDHYSGIEELLENTAADRVRIKCLVLPVTEVWNGDETKKEPEKDKDAGWNDKEEEDRGINGNNKTDGNEEIEGCKKLEQLAKKQEIHIVYMQAGDKIASDILKMECLNPVSVKDEVRNISEDKNEQSQVLYLTYKNFSALFTGDITGDSEEAMTEKLTELARIRPLTVVKVGHHGSKSSTNAEFLQTVKPFVSVISCGEKNSYGHPHKELLDRLEESGTRIYKTTESGAVTVWTDGKKVEIESFLP
ncbi:MAG: MBL fold metallo-hydrolase [Lachnospiraceae bacterium]|nr:MBL fold metallo-hydrolase [Lachnospiraceae bacterium]